ncbi:MAG: sigma-54-dependent Fis family transcriptional regulator [Deltaproteobacteria bacterium]|nr:sigma-54-dependent Fis family transcriptional regulator [Deltaproteobacteria bacterium]
MYKPDMSGDQNILLIDDDSDAILSLARALKAAGITHPIHIATNKEQGLSLQHEYSPQVIVQDLCIDEAIGPESGFELLRSILNHDSTCRVIVLTGYGTPELGVTCLKNGAASFLEKPPDISHLSALILDGIKQSDLRRNYEQLSKDSVSLTNIIGESDAIKKLRKEIEYAASNDQPLLITGETGTGKGLCAQAIHKLSKRSKGKYVRYQPNFSTPDLVNSDLFGHKKGAFTGADADRSGLLVEADTGTLFLDEIDELPLETQVSLLGVLQEKSFRPLGSNGEIASDFRLICASNQDIDQCVSEKKVRQDFYHRIAHARIHIPALRERKQDIPLLAEFFLEKLRSAEKVSVISLENDAIAKLQAYNWPGNIRELQAIVEGGAYKAQFESRVSIIADDLMFTPKKLSADSEASFHDLVEDFKLTLIEEALARHDGNQVKAAIDLQMDRSTLRRIVSRKEQ